MTDLNLDNTETAGQQSKKLHDQRTNIDAVYRKYHAIGF